MGMDRMGERDLGEGKKEMGIKKDL